MMVTAMLAFAGFAKSKKEKENELNEKILARVAKACANTKAEEIPILTPPPPRPSEVVTETIDELADELAWLASQSETECLPITYKSVVKRDENVIYVTPITSMAWV